MTQLQCVVERAACASPIENLDRINWAAPWLAPYAERGVRWQRAALADPSGFVAMLAGEAQRGEQRVTGNGRPLTFIEQAQLPEGAAYEAHIAATGGVPTRQNLHDFFNALIWFAYPRVKATLNARQARVIERDGIQGARGSERDFLTLFDENAVLFVSADPSLSAALTGFDWRTLFVDERAAWGVRCEVRMFGHALIEKLVSPYKACTGHAWIVAAPAEYFTWPEVRRASWLDGAVAASLAGCDLENGRYAPLPVLGVPGFWPANADPAFYEDRHVFREGRRRARGIGEGVAAGRNADSCPLAGGKLTRCEVGQAVAAFPAHAGKGEESPDSIGQGDG